MLTIMIIMIWGMILKMESWKVGKLESWKVGKLESWKVGKLESWKVGKLESWIIFVEKGDPTQRFYDVFKNQLSLSWQ